MAKDLWVEKYRPKTLNEYVFVDKQQEKQIRAWVEDKSIPHILLSGHAGVGKTTLAYVLFNELDVEPADILKINGSSQNGVEYIRDTIMNFVTSMPFGDFRYVLLDEADYLTPNAQGALRNLTEQYSNSARFIFTCNYPHKIIPALHSRCQVFHIDKIDREEFTIRVGTILSEEGVKLENDDIEVLDIFVDGSYPDLRKCINNMQLHTVDGVLVKPSEEDVSSEDYRIHAIQLFRDKKFKEARQLVCDQIRPEEYDDFFKFMYRNLDIWAGSDSEKEKQAIIIIRNGMAKAPLCADPEINLSATLVELEML